METIRSGWRCGFVGLVGSAIIVACGADDGKKKVIVDAGDAGVGGSPSMADGAAGAGGAAPDAPIGSGGSAGSGGMMPMPDAAPDVSVPEAGADAAPDVSVDAGDAAPEASACPDAAPVDCAIFEPMLLDGAASYFDEATGTFRTRLAAGAPAIASATLMLRFCDCEGFYGCIDDTGQVVFVPMTISGDELVADLSAQLATVTDALIEEASLLVTTVCGQELRARIANDVGENYGAPADCLTELDEIRWCETAPRPALPPVLGDAGVPPDAGACASFDGGAPAGFCGAIDNDGSGRANLNVFSASDHITAELLPGSGTVTEATATIYTCTCTGTDCVPGTGAIQNLPMVQNGNELTLDYGSIPSESIWEVEVTVATSCGQRSTIVLDDSNTRCGAKPTEAEPDGYCIEQ